MLLIKQMLNRSRSTESWLKQLQHNQSKRVLESLEELKERQFVQNGGLEGMDLSSANLRRATFAKARMKGIVLKSAILTETYFFEAELEGATLDLANLEGANFRAVRLSDSTLKQTECTATNFARAILINCDFSGAQLVGANFWNADLRGANLLGANLNGANLSGVSCDERVCLPDGTFWNPDCNWLIYTN